MAEFQRRGLVHFHALLRADGPGEPFSLPPTSMNASRLAEVVAGVIIESSVGTSSGAIRWGRQFHIADVSATDRYDLRVAAYLAKYATKTTDGSLDFACRFRSRVEITKLDTSPHLKRLALTAWDLAREPELADLNLRAHAHAFGFRGQLITKSRKFSTRFLDLRAARAAHMATENPEDPVNGSFTFLGRGYDDPRGAEVAEFLHRLTLEARRSTPGAVR